jgi:hypothetical protein
METKSETLAARAGGAGYLLREGMVKIAGDWPMILPRRQFLAGLATTLAAPAIVRADSLMKLPRPSLIRMGQISATIRTKMIPPQMTAKEAHEWLHNALQHALFEAMQTKGPIRHSNSGWDILQAAAESAMSGLPPTYNVEVTVR